MVKASELRDQTPEELEALLLDLKKELFDTVNKRAREKKIENPHKIRSLRKDIARILTVLRQKGIAKCAVEVGV